MRYHWVLTAVVLLYLGAADLARASAIIFSNLGPGGNYQSCGNICADAIGKNNQGTNTTALAMSFTPNGNFSVTQIDVAIQNVVFLGGTPSLSPAISCRL
jgi:hypothetical protein